MYTDQNCAFHFQLILFFNPEIFLFLLVVVVVVISSFHNERDTYHRIELHPIVWSRASNWSVARMHCNTNSYTNGSSDMCSNGWSSTSTTASNAKGIFCSILYHSVKRVRVRAIRITKIETRKNPRRKSFLLDSIVSRIYWRFLSLPFLVSRRNAKSNLIITSKNQRIFFAKIETIWLLCIVCCVVGAMNVVD